MALFGNANSEMDLRQFQRFDELSMVYVLIGVLQ